MLTSDPHNFKTGHFTSGAGYEIDCEMYKNEKHVQSMQNSFPPLFNKEILDVLISVATMVA